MAFRKNIWATAYALQGVLNYDRFQKEKSTIFLFTLGQIQTNFFVFGLSDTDLDPLKNQTDAQPCIAEGVFYRGI